MPAADDTPQRVNLELLTIDGSPVAVARQPTQDEPFLILWNEAGELWAGGVGTDLHGPVNQQVEAVLDAAYPGLCDLARRALGMIPGAVKGGRW